jgi:PAS domain S-box-containing protein
MSSREFNTFGFGMRSPAWVPHLASGLFTIVSIILVTLLWRRLGAISDPGLMLVLTVAVSTYIAGGMPGMLSAGIVLVCSFVLFSHPSYLFRYNELDWRQVMVIVIACPLVALLVGSLKDQVDQLRGMTGENGKLRTDVKQYEGLKDAYHLCEQRFNIITDNVEGYAVFMLDLNGVVVNWNAGAERLLGYSNKEIIGQNCSRFFTQEDVLSKMPEHILNLARFSGHTAKDDWTVRKGGTPFRAQIAATALRNSAGSPIGFLMVTRDLGRFPRDVGEGQKPR